MADEPEIDHRSQQRTRMSKRPAPQQTLERQMP